MHIPIEKNNLTESTLQRDSLKLSKNYQILIDKTSNQINLMRSNKV